MTYSFFYCKNYECNRHHQRLSQVQVIALWQYYFGSWYCSSKLIWSNIFLWHANDTGEFLNLVKKSGHHYFRYVDVLCMASPVSCWSLLTLRTTACGCWRTSYRRFTATRAPSARRQRAKWTSSANVWWVALFKMAVGMAKLFRRILNMAYFAFVIYNLLYMYNINNYDLYCTSAAIQVSK